MYYKLVVYIPENHLEKVKKALFDAGAGVQGHYDQCCWQTKGEGQFRPRQSSEPHIGQQDVIERVPEWRVEFLVGDSASAKVKRALLSAHPYEEPAYEFLACAEI